MHRAAMGDLDRRRDPLARQPRKGRSACPGSPLKSSTEAPASPVASASRDRRGDAGGIIGEGILEVGGDRQIGRRHERCRVLQRLVTADRAVEAAERGSVAAAGRGDRRRTRATRAGSPSRHVPGVGKQQRRSGTMQRRATSGPCPLGWCRRPASAVAMRGGRAGIRASATTGAGTRPPAKQDREQERPMTSATGIGWRGESGRRAPGRISATASR